MTVPRKRSHAIDPSQHVVFYPTFGRQIAGGWEIAVHAALYRRGVDDYRKRLFLGLLRRVLKAQRQDFEQEIFRRRIEGFLLREQPGKHLAIELAGKRLVLDKRTRRNGHVRVRVQVGEDDVTRLESAGAVDDGWLDFRAVTLPHDPRHFAGAAQLLSRQGVSVISDIDDTLKHTGVQQRKLTLANTFFHEFQPIPGMEGIYRTWAQQGAAFHYVSSSPWQLYEPLQQLLDAQGYPRGTFHLKAIRFRDPTLLRLFIARRLPKRRSIAGIIRAFPWRKFILVGDSGEKDPEIYGAMARRFPRQIARIYIRNVVERPLSLMRSEKAFRNVPEHLWRVFWDPAEIDPTLDDLPAPQLA